MDYGHGKKSKPARCMQALFSHGFGPSLKHKDEEHPGNQAKKILVPHSISMGNFVASFWSPDFCSCFSFLKMSILTFRTGFAYGEISKNDQPSNWPAEPFNLDGL